ncbi:Uncharacterized protein OBRU01_22960 [Operophtera brumata]|uniref:Long-chain-fatty-acid--CoA ligase n=1 Tax=Operophtera brumata TaxID=104452 RepID=A0A0L7KQA7_OPEBR|nr:Uncharacterized protein OBRU01_22960 [Operophtera brumata]
MFKIWMWERRGTSVVSHWAEVAQRYGDKKAFGDAISNRIAWYFKRQGFKSGEVIALFMETCPEYTFTWLGLAKLRVITALVNTNLRGAQLAHSLRIAGCKAVIFGDEMSDAIKDIQAEIPDIPLFQCNSPERESAPVLHNTIPLSSELREMTPDPFTEVTQSKPRDTLLYIYTSGTTGFPKAAIITNIRFLLIPLGVHTSAQLSSSDIIYDPLPLHHTAGGVLGAGQAIVLGCTVALRKKFSASNYWSDAARYGCTVSMCQAMMDNRYLSSARTYSCPNDQAHKVKVIIGNGLRPQIWQKFVERFGISRVLEFYGATEGNSNLGLLLGKIDPKKAILTFAGYADKTDSEKKIVRSVKQEGDFYFNTGDILVAWRECVYSRSGRSNQLLDWTEGCCRRAGMAAIIDPEKKLDLTLLSKGLKSSLPAYARPIFIRILHETPLTATFKLKKKDLMEQGYNISLHKDPIYFMDQKTGEYIPLTQKVYDDILQGNVRL